MKNSLKNLLIFALFLSFFSFCAAQTVSKMESKALDVQKWVTTHFGHGQLPPFSFKYGERNSSEFIRKWDYSLKKLAGSEPHQQKYLVTYHDPQSGLRINCDIAAYSDYGTVEWVLHFLNESEQNTPAISKLRTTNIIFQYPQKGIFRLHYANGSNAGRTDFAPKLKQLFPGDSLYMRPYGGRSSSYSAFPFFNIESPANQGVLAAIGWTGTWFSNIRCVNQNQVSLESGIEQVNTYLKPHEEIRSSSVCLLFWQGKDRMVGHNKFRRFLLEHHSRHIDGKIVNYPISAGFNWGDPPPCNENTCITTEYAISLIKRMKLFNILPEVFWLDAGWYEKAADYFDNKDWYNTVGNWVVDSVRFTDGFRPVTEAAHKVGSKFLLWFEPERVYKDSRWYNMHPQWLLKTADSLTFIYNLGDPEAHKWLCKYMGDFLEQNGIDIYRQDFNCNLETAWKTHDEPGRQGITEIRYIEGLYSYWDYLIQRFPNLLIDNCASGGRRIDYETMGRSAPLWRTDYQYGEPVGYQCHTYGLEFYLPQHGTASYRVDPFVSRSSLGSAVIFNWKLTQTDQSYIDMQGALKEFKEVRPYFYEDYYPLSGIGDITKDDIWLAYQLNKPSDESGYIVAFRRAQNLERNYVVKLSAVNPNHIYALLNKDTGETVKKTGKELLEGLTLILDNPRTSLLIKYTLADSPKK